MHTFIDAEYENQNFKGIVCEAEEVHGVIFQDCTFSSCSLRETTFRACRFQGCVFKRCDLSLVSVDGSLFVGTQFEDSKVIGINWVKAAWGNKEISQLLRSIGFECCVLNYSTFMGLNMERLRLHKCTVHEVDFSETNLKQADCTFSDFTNSQFRHTDLSESDFRGAINYFIQPHLNTLKGAKFSLPEAMSLLYNLDIVLGDAMEDEE